MRFVSVTREVASLRISGAVDNHALVVHSQGHPVEMAVEQLPRLSTGHYQEETDDMTTLQEQLHRLQHQMKDVLCRIQQTSQKVHHTQQQVQQVQSTQQQMNCEIGAALQTLQQLDQQSQDCVQQLRQHVEKFQAGSTAVEPIRTTK